MSEPLPTYQIQGREVGFPVVVREATSGAATYLVPSKAARALLPGPEFELVELLPGRGLCVVAMIDYKDNDLGDYDEVSIALLRAARAATGRRFPWRTWATGSIWCGGGLGVSTSTICR